MAWALMLSTPHSEARPEAKAKARNIRNAIELQKKYHDLKNGPYGNRSPGNRGHSLRLYGGSGMTEGCVLRALRWLKKHQRSDGSWLAESGGATEGRFSAGMPTAMTSLALLALLGHGETPSSMEFGSCVDKAIAWLVDDQENNGLFRGRDKMNYSHALATCALCESMAVTGNPDIRSAAKRATHVIIHGQNASGGWNYNFHLSTRNDTSFMAWCAQALFAAKAAKVEIRGLDTAVEKAAAGFKKNAAPSGAFGYVGPTDVHNKLTGAAIFSLYLLNTEAEIEIKRGLAWLSSASCDWEKPWSENPIYHWYYATQSKFHAGGEIWKSWNKDFSPDIVKNQVVVQDSVTYRDRMLDIGYWESPSRKEHCQSRVYATALCTLMLETYYRHKPVFDRKEEVDE